MRVLGGPPTSHETLYVLRYVADVLEVTLCWYYRGSYHFQLQDDWSVSLTPESAERFRVDLCRLTIPRHTRWCRCRDLRRMRNLVLDAADSYSSQPLA